MYVLCPKDALSCHTWCSGLLGALTAEGYEACRSKLPQTVHWLVLEHYNHGSSPIGSRSNGANGTVRYAPGEIQEFRSITGSSVSSVFVEEGTGINTGLS